MARHLHLDLLGGISGDMFIGALLDAGQGGTADPACLESLERVLELAGFPGLVTLECAAFNDGVLSGSQFRVESLEPASGHRYFREIRDRLEGSSLPENTRETAQDIFRRLARAEARVHGKAVEEVAFHEVGAWDSIADIVLSAHLIHHSGAKSWSHSPIPVGRGRINTSHGNLPIPAPATGLLLEGFEFFDDGVEGERVTPTGAAILNCLSPSRAMPGGTLVAQGYGFGARRLPGLSNALRVSVYEGTRPGTGTWQADRVIRLSFEIDDQTPEDLGHTLDRLRRKDGVLDVKEDVYGAKKNRCGHAVTVLTKPEAETEATAFCFDHTSTLGIRREVIDRAILPRRDYEIEHQGRIYRVKVVQRPGGLTAKVDMDDLARAQATRGERDALRGIIESLGLKAAARDFG